MYENFFTFWKLYPKHMAFKKSMEVWNSLNSVQHQKAIETIPKHAELWKAEGREDKYIPMAFSWLSGERFEDEIEIPEANNGKFNATQYVAGKLDECFAPKVQPDVHGKIYTLLPRQGNG